MVLNFAQELNQQPKQTVIPDKDQDEEEAGQAPDPFAWPQVEDRRGSISGGRGEQNNFGQKIGQAPAQSANQFEF